MTETNRPQESAAAFIPRDPFDALDARGDLSFPQIDDILTGKVTLDEIVFAEGVEGVSHALEVDLLEEPVSAVETVTTDEPIVSESESRAERLYYDQGIISPGFTPPYLRK